MLEIRNFMAKNQVLMEIQNEACYRENIRLGMKVAVVLKKDQRSGNLTTGIVRWILTSKPYHSRGIKVLIDSRQIGRVRQILELPPWENEPTNIERL
jgi:uncharacterized repeat protein (TIGR03833 family)